ncbi:MAG TPA: hypothetical protein VGL56_11630 [Fimbriimonadaceae bacterium]|jgi:hypothetical protein
MKRRVIAKPKPTNGMQIWVKEFVGKDPIRAYRKHFHASWSCAIVELGMLGFQFSEEDILEANRRQTRCQEGKRQKQTKKPGKKAAGTWGVDFDDNFAFIAGFTSGGAPFGTTWQETIGLDETPKRRRTPSQAQDDYDPFA